jgi:N4-gp56 family major capsid protein
MTAATEYGDITPRVAVYAAKDMLKRGLPYLVLEKFGQAKPLPTKHSKVQKFRRYNALSLATSALTEGVTPTAKQLAVTDVTATLSQYGDLVTITDVVQDTHEDPVLKEASEVLGEQAAQTIETIRFNVIKAGTTVQYANGEARNAVNTEMTLADQRTATRTLKRQSAKRLTSVVRSTTNYGTESIAPSFIGLIHPDFETVIRSFSGFVPTEKYGQLSPFESEIGKVEDVRYVTSTVFAPWEDAGATKGAMISTSNSNADVYPCIILGRDAYGIVPLKGKNSLTPSVINPNTPSKSDPLGQRGHVSWKSMQTAVILNDLWMVRIESAVTD